MTVFTVNFEMAFVSATQDNNQIILLLFFFLFLQDFIQLCDSRIRDSCEIRFRVQFNVEFPRHVMNFPIKLWFLLTVGTRGI